MKVYTDKVAVITGAASGIGRALAERCVREGMRVVLADVEAAPLDQTKKALSTPDRDVLALVTNVSEARDIDVLARQTLDTFGRVDLLFNNAGVAAGDSLWESTQEDCQWVMGVNLWGVINCVRKFVPLMIEQDSACRIVNTSSIAGLSSYHPSALYQLTKHGIVALSEQLHHDLAMRGTKVRVSVLCPGFVKTGIMDAERNRPEKYRSDGMGAAVDPEKEAMAREFRRLLENGMPPATVAELVFAAIREDRFYIFTHPELTPLMQTRMEDIIQGRNPSPPSM